MASPTESCTVSSSANFPIRSARLLPRRAGSSPKTRQILFWALAARTRQTGQQFSEEFYECVDILFAATGSGSSCNCLYMLTKKINLSIGQHVFDTASLSAAKATVDLVLAQIQKGQERIDLVNVVTGATEVPEECCPFVGRYDTSPATS